jgi:hypothetical protein
MEQCDSHQTDFCVIFIWGFYDNLVVHSDWLISGKNNRQFTCRPAYISDNPLPLFSFVTETECVLCEIESKAQEKVDESNITIKHDHS